MRALPTLALCFTLACKASDGSTDEDTDTTAAGDTDVVDTNVTDTDVAADTDVTEDTDVAAPTVADLLAAGATVQEVLDAAACAMLDKRHILTVESAALRVVDAISCHSDDYAIALESADESKLLDRDYAGEDAHLSYANRKISITECFKFISCNNASLVVKPYLLRNGERSSWIVARQHNCSYASFCTE